MMKYRFLALLAAIAVLMAPSCGEKQPADNGNSGGNGSSTLKFESTTEAIDSTPIVWSAYDEISVVGEGSTTTSTLKLSSGSGKITSVFSGNVATAEKYYAFYPAADASVVSNGVFAFELSRSRAAGESIYECGAIHRAAEGTVESGFEFRNLFGFVELRISGTGTMSSIKINTSSDAALSGTFSYDIERQQLTTINGNSSAVVRLPRTITLSSTPKSIFVMLPEGSYKDVTITLSGDRGQQYFVEGDVVVERSSVTTVSNLTLNEEYVDLSFIGDWHLTQFCGTAAEADIYLSLKDDDSFTLYQRDFDYQMSVYEGLYNYDSRTSTISGEYSDGVKWSADYSVAMNGEDTMIWTNKSTNEVSVYERCELQAAPETSATRGATDVKRFL